MVFAVSQFSQAQDPAKPPLPNTPPVQPLTNQTPHSQGGLPIQSKGMLAPAGKAAATLESKSGSRVTGEVKFSNAGTGVRGEYTIRGLSDGKVYGFHIHEKGDCSSADAKSAGKHYMQISATGGTSKDNPEKYAGDLPSVKADSKGEATGTFIARGLTINHKNGIADRAIILHDGPDDISKNSAARIACGVIKN